MSTPTGAGISPGLKYLDHILGSFNDPTQDLWNSVVSDNGFSMPGERKQEEKEVEAKNLDELSLCDFEVLEPLPFAPDHAHSFGEDDILDPMTIIGAEIC